MASHNALSTASSSVMDAEAGGDRRNPVSVNRANCKKSRRCSRTVIHDVAVVIHDPAARPMEIKTLQRHP